MKTFISGGFREQFFSTLLELGRNNFAYKEVSVELQKWKEIYEEQLLINHKRFFGGQYGKEELEQDFALIDDFFARRYQFMERAIEEIKEDNRENGWY